jgi:formylglycine-generating enzyme required for sulfatase activity
MKYLLLPLLLIFSASSFAQIFIDPSMKKAPYTFKWIEKDKTVMQETEVTVEQYIYYLKGLSEDSAQYLFEDAIPPGLKPYYGESGNEYEFNKVKFEADQKFTDKKSLNNPYKKPITNVSYEQALNYCIYYTFKGNRNINTRGYAKKIIKFRLPTAAEYERIGMEGITKGAALQKKIDVARYTKDMLACINDKGCALCNHSGKGNCEGNTKLVAMYGNELYPAGTFFPNGYGLWDMQGNAAEIVMEDDKVMGGSYKDKVENCKPGSIQGSDGGPQPWIGFRLIGEVVEVDGEDVWFDDLYLHIKNYFSN